MRPAPPLAVLAFLAAGCADAPEPAAAPPAPPAPPVAEAASLAAADAYVRAAPAGGVSAVFFRLENGTATPDTLVAARTDAASRVQVHETTESADGLRGMREADRVAVPAGGAVAFEPGGLHVMLLDLRRGLAEGDTVDLALDFAEGQTLALRVPVRGLQ
ncbi:copper chaperone PCu(A)C [Rubrivirga sp. S365]|uniref:copper chaperone PCu(A)C n=1 Tax=Rubrivirga sp. S365 TaxID=3076080 RepID=UPI0028C6C327|nr:copper chaperone PCu(A)C [Rubrivirga sp. S365]MDT7857820.1 copper chaperone PCu(A)C [Rubrivirga sp. S365]